MMTYEEYMNRLALRRQGKTIVEIAEELTTTQAVDHGGTTVSSPTTSPQRLNALLDSRSRQPVRSATTPAGSTAGGLSLERDVALLVDDDERHPGQAAQLVLEPHWCGQRPQ